MKNFKDSTIWMDNAGTIILVTYVGNIFFGTTVDGIEGHVCSMIFAQKFVRSFTYIGEL